MKIALPPLPYGYDALEPHISKATLETHHDKHHAAYVDKAKSLAPEAGMGSDSLEQIIAKTAGKDAQKALFNNAAQAWNHTFYWHSLSAKGGKPQGDVAKLIDKAFGDFDTFGKKFAEAAVGQFGSGWAWLVADGDTLKITTTSNADTPLAHKQVPLLTLDVWEHAYYIDYRNRRPDYAAAVVKNLLNWDFAGENLKRAKSGADSFVLAD
ncbi:MAG TPA: superoxide dismutase [Dongiaceae bacterium]|jgi:Fe-Mn family superoxide dismutase